MSQHDDGRVSCPVTGCGERIERELLMCRMHWRMVPRRLQQEVNEAFRRWRRSFRTRDLPGMRQTGDELRFAQAAAIAAIRPENDEDGRAVLPDQFVPGAA